MARAPTPIPSRPWSIAACNFAAALAAGAGVVLSVGGWMGLHSPKGTDLDNVAFGLALYPVAATVLVCIVAALCCGIGGSAILAREPGGARMAAAGIGFLLLPLGGWGVLFLADGLGGWLVMLGVAALVALLTVVNLLTAKDLRGDERIPIIRLPERP